MILKEKNLVLKEKYLEKFQYFEKILWKMDNVMDTLSKMSQNIFAYSFVSEHSNIFCILIKKMCFFSDGGGGSFFDVLPKLCAVLK